MSAPAEVRLRGFGWRHAGRKAPAVAGLDLHIPAGQRVLLAGGSGSGKTTLLHAVLGLLDPESGHASGEVLVAGEPPRPRAGRAGLVLQDPDSQAVLSRLGDDIAFGLENHRWDPEAIWPRVRECRDAVGLELPLSHPTTALSGGQKQRLALAGVIAYAPGLVVLDEPTAAIDPASITGLRDAVIELCSETGATLLVVEHRLEAWVPVMDRMLVLGREGILADGPPEELLADPGHAGVLDAAGVWRPGPHPLADDGWAPSASPGEVLLRGSGLAVARQASGPVAADGLDIALRAGEATALLGANGAGKSTAALTLTGFLPPRAGIVEASPALLAHAAATPARGRRARARRASADPARWSSADLVSRIGVVFQEPEHQLLCRTVAEELLLGLSRSGVAEAPARERVAALLDGLGLSRLSQAHPLTLSGGEKRRLTVAAILAADPPVIVLDEPTFGQDARTWTALVNLIRDRIERGAAVLAVTHDEAFRSAIGARPQELSSGNRRAA